MDKKNLLAFILLSVSLLYSFDRSESARSMISAESGNVQDSFILGAVHDYLDSTYVYLSDTLCFNVWHKYTAPRDWGWPVMHSNRSTLSADQLDTPVHRYSADIRARLDTNNGNNLLTLMDRPKFQYLAFGQRSDYQCEDISKVDQDYWFYTYHNSADNGSTIKDTLDYSNGGTGYVKRCLYNRSNPGSNARMLFDSLRGNMEQINTFWGVSWLGDSLYDWYIMPRIRIDTAFANNPANQNTEVCKVIIKNRDGDSITQVIKVKNFFEPQFNTYSGEFLEEFYSYSGSQITNLKINAGTWFNDDPAVDFGDQNCRVDFKVFWYDKCDMWIDRIRVENEPAHEMLTLQFPRIEEWIRAEVQDIAMAEINSGNESPYKFYIEEFEMNHLPCIAYLNKKIIEHSDGRMSLMVNYNHDLVKAFIPNSWTKMFTSRQVKKYLIDSAKIREIFTECYNFEGWNNTEHGGGRESYVPTTLYSGPDYDIYNGILAYKVSPSVYDDWIQDHFDNYGVAGLNLRHILQFSDSVSRLGNVPFQFLHQAHLWMSNGHMLKEPSNEEMAMTANLAISYGAKGLMYFAWNSANPSYDTTGGVICSRGLVNADYGPRTINVYGQYKWDGIKQINQNIKRWESYLMSFDNSNRRSYILRSEYNDLYSQTFFSDVITYKPFGSAPACTEDNPNSNVPGTVFECKIDRYLQVFVFQNSEPNTKNFMIVNRRCAPYLNDSTNNDNNGGRRFVKVKLDSGSAAFRGFNNWSIYDVANDSLIQTFDKNTKSDINLGWYMPGEGRLYKLAPVMQEACPPLCRSSTVADCRRGGTLVADEDCGGFEFECKGEVNNNGYDISIKPQTTILFSNTSARISMDGGSFYSGSSSESIHLYLKAKSGGTWRGFKLSNCDDAYIRNTFFENISPYPVDSTYAVELTDCGSIKVSNCVFSASSTGKTGSLLIAYTSQGDPEDVYISSNTFNLNTGSMPAVSVIATGYDEVPMLMEWNEFESCPDNNTLAILLSNVTGGAIKENNFTGYDKTVFMLGSSMDFYGNYILGSDQSSVGIVQHSASNANLSASGEMFTGGYNSITAEGQTARCIQLSNSYLLIDDGFNIFRLEDSQTNNYQLEGTIPNDFGADPYPAENNCFQIGSGVLVKHNLRWIDESPINLDTVPSGCNSERPGNFMVFNLGNGVSDTIHYSSGGSGSGNSTTGSINETVSLKTLADSVAVNLRKRHYQSVSASCRELLTTFADSIGDASMISKLYLAELKQDTGSIRMSELKSFLESYILNNPENEVMVNQAYYMIQKCKVKLGQYESAMAGFQQIMNMFPYGYEGLLASWDYAATSLLSVGGSGQGIRGGGFSDEKDNVREISDRNMILIDDPKESYDKTAFTKEERKRISVNLTKSFTRSAQQQKQAITDLEEKMSKGMATETDKERYRSMTLLKDMTHPRKPENTISHLREITADINNLLSAGTKDMNETEDKNLIPGNFALHQNYPNPFNPSTKITFDIPVDARVKLVVYDLLGRQVAKLVDNELKAAGSYAVEFNGASLASGVYFCRIEAGRFLGTKRMVLVK